MRTRGSNNWGRWLCSLGIGSLVLLPLLVLTGCSGGDDSKQDVAWEAAKDAAAEAPPISPARPAAASRPALSAEDAERLANEPNKPPHAEILASPTKAWGDLTAVEFSAGLCTDDRDLASQLLKRWDFDGDGTWDTPATRLQVMPYVFREPGSYEPRLWIQDTGGLVDSVVGEAVTVVPSCPPPDFALVDVNPNSPSLGDTLRLSEQSGHRVLMWYTAPSK